MSKYYKHHNGLTLKWVKDNPKDFFTGIVVEVGGSGWELKKRNDYFYFGEFTQYTPTPQELSEWGETETVSNDDPNKVEVDQEETKLRLECLKLAANSNKGIAQTANVIVAEAQEFYDWITKKD